MESIKRTCSFILEHPLGKRNLIKSIARFCWWQLQNRIAPKRFFVKGFVYPVKFWARKGLHGITGNIYTGLHEFNDMGFLLHFLRPTDTFFDVGANVGSFTLLAGGVCKAKTVSIEAAADTFEILKKNIALNDLQTTAITINAAAGSGQGTIKFTSGEDATNHVIALDEEDRQGIKEVTVITVDSLATNRTPALIKIDVEGFETEVLKGMVQTLDSSALKAIIIELNGSGGRYGFDEGKIHELLLSKQFMPHTYNPFERTLTMAPSHGEFNTIYCRDMAFIEDRLKNAARFKVMGEAI